MRRSIAEITSAYESDLEEALRDALRDVAEATLALERLRGETSLRIEVEPPVAAAPLPLLEPAAPVMEKAQENEAEALQQPPATETKTCTLCGRAKPLSEFYRSQGDYLRSECKSCGNKQKWERLKAQRSKAPTSPAPLKCCNICGIEKPQAEFYPRQGCCKPCFNRRNEASRKAREARLKAAESAQESPEIKQIGLDVSTKPAESIQIAPPIKRTVSVAALPKPERKSALRAAVKELLEAHPHITQQNLAEWIGDYDLCMADVRQIIEECQHSAAKSNHRNGGVISMKICPMRRGRRIEMEAPQLDCPQCGREIIQRGGTLCCTRCAYRVEIAPFRTQCAMPLCSKLAESGRTYCSDCEQARMPKD